MSKAKEILKSRFGFDEFRLEQGRIIESVLQKKDTVVLMPTGGGKSLCFQIPALILPGMTVVISPLIALMRDQVNALRLNGIAAAFLNSTQTEAERAATLAAVRRGEIKLLYLAPERLFFNDSEFVDALKEFNVSLFAIDEAHCISQWGHDFRPEYLRLAALKREFPGVPVIALTATADKLTRADILEKLALRSPQVFISSFDRKNIHYFIEPKENHRKKLLEYLSTRKNESGIVYALSRQSVDEIAGELHKRKFSALPYHAGLDKETRDKNQDQFIEDKVKIIVATIAFGMGIDKSNVRFVIHMDMPKNIESYYQETGRAGRDGLKSEAVLYYGPGDVVKLKSFAQIDGNARQTEILTRKLNQMARFCESRSTCRRKFLLNYFDEACADTCASCDACLNKYEKHDATDKARQALGAVVAIGPFGVNYIIDVVRGSKSAKMREHHTKLPVYGSGATTGKEEWRQLFYELIEMAYLSQEGEYPVLRLTKKGQSVLEEGEEVLLTKFAGREKAVVSDLPHDEELFALLKTLRWDLASEASVPAYLIFSDATLRELATYLPTDKEALRRISGFGEIKLAKYGDAFLEIVKTYAAGKNLPSRITEKQEKKKPASSWSFLQD